MIDKDPYASEAKTQALLVPDTQTKAERKLAKMMAERGADEQGAEDYLILRQIAVDLLAEQPAQRTWVGLTDDEIVNILPDDDTPMSLGEAFFKFAELVEAKIKDKNT